MATKQAKATAEPTTKQAKATEQVAEPTTEQVAEPTAAKVSKAKPKYELAETKLRKFIEYAQANWDATVTQDVQTVSVEPRMAQDGNLKDTVTDVEVTSPEGETIRLTFYGNIYEPPSSPYTGRGHKFGIRNISAARRLIIEGGPAPVNQCDARCTSAKSANCSCDCGGKNHGTDGMDDAQAEAHRQAWRDNGGSLVPKETRAKSANEDKIAA